MDMFGTDFKRVGAPGRVPGLSGSVDHGKKNAFSKDGAVDVSAWDKHEFPPDEIEQVQTNDDFT